MATHNILSNETPKIEVNGLNFFYGTHKALKDINLVIPEKKVTAFIGPSGCGKSTLLRTLNRMFELYPGQTAEGEIKFEGENILTSCVQKSVWCFKNRPHSR